MNIMLSEMINPNKTIFPKTNQQLWWNPPLKIKYLDSYQDTVIAILIRESLSMTFSHSVQQATTIRKRRTVHRKSTKNLMKEILRRKETQQQKI